MTAEYDQRIVEVIESEKARLKSFIWRQVADKADAEDILQDVFYELVEVYWYLKPIEKVGAWLLQVARNRIIDRFRKRKPESSTNDPVQVTEDGEELSLEDILPSTEAGPEAVYARSVLLEELEQALDELSEEQREVFISHEIEGRSFKELAAETGLSLNTLLSRKHYAVIHLRRRLQDIYDEIEKG